MTDEHSELAFAIRDLTEAVRKLKPTWQDVPAGVRPFTATYTPGHEIVVDTPDGPERYVCLPPPTATPPEELPYSEDVVKSKAYGHYGDGFIGGPGFTCDHSFKSIEMIVRRLNDLADLATHLAKNHHLRSCGHARLPDCVSPVCQQWKRLCYVEK